MKLFPPSSPYIATCCKVERIYQNKMRCHTCMDGLLMMLKEPHTHTRTHTRTDMPVQKTSSSAAKEGIILPMKKSIRKSKRNKEKKRREKKRKQPPRQIMLHFSHINSISLFAAHAQTPQRRRRRTMPHRFLFHFVSALGSIPGACARPMGLAVMEWGGR